MNCVKEAVDMVLKAGFVIVINVHYDGAKMNTGDEGNWLDMGDVLYGSNF
jgi:hypothetical protein